MSINRVTIALAWSGWLAIGLVGAASGLILKVLGYLFHRRLDAANQRMDHYHQEQLQTYWFELLLAASEQLPAKQQQKTVQKIIHTANAGWLGGAAELEPAPAACGEN